MNITQIFETTGEMQILETSGKYVESNYGRFDDAVIDP